MTPGIFATLWTKGSKTSRAHSALLVPKEEVPGHNTNRDVETSNLFHIVAAKTDVCAIVEVLYNENGCSLPISLPKVVMTTIHLMGRLESRQS